MDDIVRSTVVVLLLLLFAGPVAAAEIVGMARVTDGDHLEIAGTRIRLFGIDAPEKAQTCERAGDQNDPCGRRAEVALRELVHGREIRCEERRREPNGVVAAICYDGLADINAAMVRLGHAIAYLRDSKVYLAEQAAAQRAKRGIWASYFETPADWRRKYPSR